MAHFLSHYENTATDLDRRDGMIRVSGVQWFTNMDTSKRHEDLINLDAIEVGKTNEIPMDYDGLMGVPITFLEKYNPDQFTIVGSFNSGSHGEQLGAVKTEAEAKGKVIMWNGPVVDRKPLYKRIIIMRKRR